MLARVSIFAFILFSFLMPGVVFAQTSSCCSQNGGVYACNSATSQLYCKDGTLSRECTCHVSTPTPSPSPTPTPIPTAVPTVPACVAYSTFDSASNSCKCNSGYAVNDNACVTYKEFCWSKFGGNSTFDESNNTCACSSGYAWNSETSTCVSFNDYCQKKLGDKSYYSSENNTCNCYPGYAIQDNKCQPIPSPIPPNITTSVKISPAPVPSSAPVKTENATPTPTKKNKSSTLIVKDLGEESFVAVAKPHNNFIKQILINIWNFITHHV